MPPPPPRRHRITPPTEPRPPGVTKAVAQDAPADPLAVLDAYVLRALELDPHEINDEYMRWAATYGRFNHLYAEAYRDAERAEVHRKKLEAEVARDYRAELIESGSKTTEDIIKQHVATHPLVVSAQYEEIDHRYEEKRLRGVLVALDGKREMLVSMGAHIRKEMDGDPSIRAAHAARRAIDEEKRDGAD